MADSGQSGSEDTMNLEGCADDLADRKVREDV